MIPAFQFRFVPCVVVPEDQVAVSVLIMKGIRQFLDAIAKIQVFRKVKSGLVNEIDSAPYYANLFSSKIVSYVRGKYQVSYGILLDNG